MSGRTCWDGDDRKYNELLSGIVTLLEQGRQFAACSVNEVLTSTYWLVSRRLVEHEQGGAERAAYGSELLKLLSRDLLIIVARAPDAGACVI